MATNNQPPGDNQMAPALATPVVDPTFTDWSKAQPDYNDTPASPEVQPDTTSRDPGVQPAENKNDSGSDLESRLKQLEAQVSTQKINNSPFVDPIDRETVRAKAEESIKGVYQRKDESDFESAVKTANPDYDDKEIKDASRKALRDYDADLHRLSNKSADVVARRDSELARVQHEFPMLNPESDQYNSDVAEQISAVYKQVAGQETDLRGAVVDRINVFPYHFTKQMMALGEVFQKFGEIQKSAATNLENSKAAAASGGRESKGKTAVSEEVKGLAEGFADEF